MVWTLVQLEIQAIDGMSREQLLNAIARRRNCLPPDLLEGLETQPTERLGLVLLAARLVYALRFLNAQERPAGAPPGPWT